MAEFNLSVKNAVKELDTLIAKFTEVSTKVGNADYKALEDSAKRIADVHKQSLEALKNVHLELKSSKNLYKSVTDVVNKNGVAIKKATAAIKSKFQQVKELLSIYKRQISESKSLAKNYKELTTEISFVKKELSFYISENEKLIRSNKKGSTTYKNNIKAINILSGRLEVLTKIKRKTVTVSEKEIAVRKVLDGERHKAIATSNKLLSSYNKENTENNKAVEQYKKLISSIKRLKAARDKLNRSTTRLQQANKLTDAQAQGRAKKIAVLTKEITRLEQIQRKTAGTTKKLIYETGVLNRALKSSGKSAIKKKSRLDLLNEALRRNVSVTNRARRSTASFGGLLRKVFVTVGLYGGLYRLFSVISRGIRTVREFEKGIYTIAGIFRTTRENILDLENAILKTARTSVKTVVQVTELAEGLATLGKTKDEIIDLIKPVTDLSIALNTGGKDAGNFLIQVLNSFGASSDEAEEYADIIATIRTSTSLDFQKMRDSFQYLSPISRLLNKDLAYTGALIGILADNGIKAQRAGRLMSSAQQRMAQDGIVLSQALETINRHYEQGIRGARLLAVATDLFGQEAAALGSILALNIDALDRDADSIRNNEGAIKDLVGEQLKSLDAILLVLNARYEDLLITTGKTTGVIDTFKRALQFLAVNLKLVITSAIWGAGAFGAWKLVLLPLILNFGRLTLAAKGLRLAILLKIGALKGLEAQSYATSRALVALKWAWRSFLASTGVGILVVALGILAGRIYSTVTASEKLAEKTGKLTDAYAKEEKRIVKLEERLKNLVQQYDNLNKTTDKVEGKEEKLNKILLTIAISMGEGADEARKYTKAFKTEDIDKFIGRLKVANELVRATTLILLKEQEQGLLKNIDDKTAEQERLAQEINIGTYKVPAHYTEPYGMSGNRQYVKEAIFKFNAKQIKARNTQFLDNLVILGQYAVKKEELLKRFQKMGYRYTDEQNKEIRMAEKLEALKIELANQGIEEIEKLYKKRVQALRKFQEANTGYSKTGHPQNLNAIKMAEDNDVLESYLETLKKLYNKEGDSNKRGGIKLKVDTSEIDLAISKLKRYGATLKDQLEQNEVTDIKSYLVEEDIAKDYYDNKGKIIEEENKKAKEIIKFAHRGEGEVTKKHNYELLIQQEKYDLKKENLARETIDALIDINQQYIDALDDTHKKTIEGIENKYDAEYNEKAYALKNIYSKLGILTKEEKNKYDSELEVIRRETNNKEIQELIAHWEQYRKKLEEQGRLTKELILEIDQKIKSLKADFELNVTNNKVEDAEDKQYERGLQLAAKFNDRAQELANTLLQGKLQAIDTEIRAEEAKYDRLIELADGDKLQQASLREQKEASLRKLTQKRYKAEVAQFRTEQAFAVTRIAIDLALEIAKNKGQTGTVFSIPLNAIAIASAVIQAASVTARKPPPPPAYKDGVENLGQDEIAMINDGISKEYVERDGQILSTNQKNAIVELKKGDTVYKNYDDMFRKTLIASAVIEGKYISENEFNKLSDTIELSIEKGFKKSKINNTIKLNNIVHNDNYLNEKSRWN